jgi:hypothetical protein
MKAVEVSPLSKAEICRKAGISRPTLDRYLTLGVPGLAEIARLADILDVHPLDLLGVAAPENRDHDLQECLRRVNEAAMSSSSPHKGFTIDMVTVGKARTPMASSTEPAPLDPGGSPSRRKLAAFVLSNADEAQVFNLLAMFNLHDKDTLAEDPLSAPSKLEPKKKPKKP